VFPVLRPGLTRGKGLQRAGALLAVFLDWRDSLMGPALPGLSTKRVFDRLPYAYGRNPLAPLTIVFALGLPPKICSPSDCPMFGLYWPFFSSCALPALFPIRPNVSLCTSLLPNLLTTFFTPSHFLKAEIRVGYFFFLGATCLRSPPPGAFPQLSGQ